MVPNLIPNLIWYGFEGQTPNMIALASMLATLGVLAFENRFRRTVYFLRPEVNPREDSA